MLMQLFVRWKDTLALGVLLGPQRDDSRHVCIISIKEAFIWTKRKGWRAVKRMDGMELCDKV